MLMWDDKQCKLSPGLRVEAVIINTLMNRRPLYRLEEFFSDMDVSKMFGPGVKADDINDDAVGRALDKLAEANPREVYGTVSLKAVCHEGVSVEVLHADTTSVSVQGAYEENNEDDALWLTFGYSKQRRPDLKQFMYGLGVTDDHFPVIAEVRNGNTSDKTWNYDLINRLRKWIGNIEDVTYVADSSLVSGPNLKAMKEQGVRFISRIPGTFKPESSLKDRAWEDGNWEYVGALSERKDASSYSLQSYVEDLDGIRYRFIVVHSSKLEVERKRASNAGQKRWRLRFEKT